MDARGNSHFAQPEDNIEEEELKKVLSETMDLLTEKERKVILLYYYEELTLKEISNILEVSESRVSQLHTKALLKMRKKMGSYMGILTVLHVNKTSCFKRDDSEDAGCRESEAAGG